MAGLHDPECFSQPKWFYEITSTSPLPTEGTVSLLKLRLRLGKILLLTRDLHDISTCERQFLTLADFWQYTAIEKWWPYLLGNAGGLFFACKRPLKIPRQASLKPEHPEWWSRSTSWLLASLAAAGQHIPQPAYAHQANFSAHPTLLALKMPCSLLY